jgi:hypothetical protein
MVFHFGENDDVTAYALGVRTIRLWCTVVWHAVSWIILKNIMNHDDIHQHLSGMVLYIERADE